MLTNDACDQAVNPDWYAAMVASSSAGSSPASWNSPGSPGMPSGEKGRRSRPAENDGPSARRTTTSAASAAHAPTAARARQVAGVCALRRSGAASTTSSRRPESSIRRPASPALSLRSAGGPGWAAPAVMPVLRERRGTPPSGGHPAAAGRDGPAPPVRSALLALAARGAAAAAQAHVVLGEDPVDEAVGPSRLLRQRADAGAVRVLLRELAGELGSVGARDPGALLDSLGH